MEQRLPDDDFSDIKFSDIKSIKEFLEKIKSCNCIGTIRDKDTNKFLLHYAVEQKRLDWISILCDNGCDVDIKDQDNFDRTPLHIAVLGNGTDICEILVNHGADCNALDSNNCTPLMLGLVDEPKLDIDIVRCLCEADNFEKASLNPNRVSPTPLLYALKHQRIDILEALISYGADPSDICGRGDLTPLIVAAQTNFLEGLEILTKNEKVLKYVDKRHEENYAALHYAVRDGRQECVKVLLKAGADVNLRENKCGRSPLMLAMSATNSELLYKEDICGFIEDDPSLQCPEMIELLLKHPKIDINAIDTYSGMTALHRACDAGKAKYVDMLLCMNADPNIIDSDGVTPLSLAINQNWIHVVIKLLQAGADIGLTPYIFNTAAVRGNKEIMWALVMACDDMNLLFQWNELSLIKVRPRNVDFSDLFKLLSAKASGPLELKEQARKAIRSNIVMPKYTNTGKIPLPQSLVEFVTMAVLEDLLKED